MNWYMKYYLSSLIAAESIGSKCNIVCQRLSRVSSQVWCILWYSLWEVSALAMVSNTPALYWSDGLPPLDHECVAVSSDYHYHVTPCLRRSKSDVIHLGWKHLQFTEQVMQLHDQYKWGGVNVLAVRRNTGLIRRTSAARLPARCWLVNLEYSRLTIVLQHHKCVFQKKY